MKVLTFYRNEKCITACSLIGLAVLVLILVLVLVKGMKKQRTHARVIESEDLNPVYGMYYFSNDGGRIDKSRSEVADTNEYYGK